MYISFIHIYSGVFRILRFNLENIIVIRNRYNLIYIYSLWRTCTHHQSLKKLKDAKRENKEDLLTDLISLNIVNNIYY